jgi:hypothetical protein
MAIKEWSTTYPTTQDPDAFTNQPDLSNGADETRVSQIHTMRNKLHAVAKEVGTNPGNQPAGCLRARVASLEGSVGSDTDAIHDNVSGEIAAITEKGVPVAGDLLVIEDSAAGNVKRRVQIGNLPGGGGSDPNAIHDNVTGEIAAVTEKGVPLAADLILIEDTAAGNAKKRVQLTNTPASKMVGDASNLPAGSVNAILDKDHTEGAAKQLKLYNRTTKPTNVADTGFLYTRTTEGDTELYYEDDQGNESQLTQDGESIGKDLGAYHSNETGEISTTPEKVTPVSGDFMVIESVADGNAKRRVQIGNLPTGSDADAIHDNVAAEISAITEKATPVSADLILIEDSADSNNKKKVQIGNLPGGGGGGGPVLLFSDDTEFTETGTTLVTKKQFRLVVDSANAFASYRVVLGLWTTSGSQTAEAEVSIGGDSALYTESGTTEAVKKSTITRSLGGTDTFLDVTIKLRIQVSGDTAHIKYTDIYGIY